MRRARHVAPVGLGDSRFQEGTGRDGGRWLSVDCSRPPAGLDTAPGGYSRLSRLYSQGPEDGQVGTQGLRGLQDHEVPLSVPGTGCLVLPGLDLIAENKLVI